MCQALSQYFYYVSKKMVRCSITFYVCKTVVTADSVPFNRRKTKGFQGTRIFTAIQVHPNSKRK